jgi:hypothetical protein
MIVRKQEDALSVPVGCLRIDSILCGISAMNVKYWNGSGRISL